jgi:hypothetical protein
LIALTCHHTFQGFDWQVRRRNISTATLNFEDPASSKLDWLVDATCQSSSQAKNRLAVRRRVPPIERSSHLPTMTTKPWGSNTRLCTLQEFAKLRGKHQRSHAIFRLVAASGGQWRPVAAGGGQWRQMAAVGGGSASNLKSRDE